MVVASLRSLDAETNVFAHVCRAGSEPSALCDVSLVKPPEPMGSCSPYSQGTIRNLKWCCWSASQDGHISAAIIMGTVPGMEAGPIGYWSRLLAKEPPGVVIDAGAQVGLFTGTALSLGHHVVAVDARPEHVRMIATSLKLNHMEGAATVVHAALGSECGKTVTIEQHEPGNPGSSHIKEHRRRKRMRRLREQMRRLQATSPHAHTSTFQMRPPMRGQLRSSSSFDNPLTRAQSKYRQPTRFLPVGSARGDQFHGQHQSKVPMLTLDSIVQWLRQSRESLGVHHRGQRYGSPLTTIPSNAPIHAIKLDVEGLEGRVFMGAASLMVRALRPKLVIMELFVQRLHACNVRNFLGGFGLLNYTMDVSPRLNMPYCENNRARCVGVSHRNGKLAPFLASLLPNAEMDLVFHSLSAEERKGKHPLAVAPRA